MKTLFKVLAIQVITIFVVIFVFKTVPNIKVAGVAGGLVFLGTSLFNLHLLKTGRLRKTFVFYATVLFVLLFVLPMLLSRIYHFDVNFDQVKIFGFKGESFHYWSEKYYLILLLATVFELIKFKLSEKKQQPS